MTVTIKNFGNLNKGTVQVTQGNKRAITRFGPDYTGSMGDNLYSEMSCGLEGLNDFMAEFPFINIAKLARFFSNDANEFLTYDANGYPVTWTGEPSILFARKPDKRTSAVDYVFEWDGPATFFDPGGTFGTGGGVTSVADNRIEFTIGPGAGNIYFAYPDDDSGGYVTNFRMYRPSDKADLDAGRHIRQDFIDFVTPMGCHRYMDWQQTNDSSIANWSDIAQLSDATWGGKVGDAEIHPPIEVIVELANRAKVDPWICIPHQALSVNNPTDYIENLATYLRDNLHTDLMAKIESSNETWNDQFDQSAWLETEAAADGWDVSGGYSVRPNYLQKLMTLAYKRFREAFGPTYAQRVIFIAPSGRNQQNSFGTPLIESTQWQTEEPDDWLPVLDYVDAFSTAHYFGTTFSPPFGTNATIDELLTRIGNGETQAQINTWIDSVVVSEDYVNDCLTAMQTNIDFATSHGLRFYPYEGNNHMLHSNYNSYTDEETDDIVEYLGNWMKSANAVVFLDQLWTGIRSKGISFELFVLITGSAKKSGDFTAYHGSDERLGVTTSPRADYWRNKQTTAFSADWYDPRRPVIDQST